MKQKLSACVNTHRGIWPEQDGLASQRENATPGTKYGYVAEHGPAA
jgi:hypothetical protein